MESVWRIELLGGLRVRRGEQLVSHFRTRKMADLLAYLAYFRQRRHPREVLIELLWPEAQPDAARHNLSMALSSLRQLLETPGPAHGAALVVNHHSVGLSSVAVTTDVAEFEAALKAAARAAAAPTR
jgi:DNA-binding SARP family transcriptional activator